MIDETQNLESQHEAGMPADEPEDFGIDTGDASNKSDVNKKMSKIIGDRLRSVNQKRTEAESRAAAAEAERDALKEQMLKSMNGQQQQIQQQWQQDPQQQMQGQPQLQMTPEMMQQMIQQSTKSAVNQGKVASFYYKINDAASQDPELKDLTKTGNELSDEHINLLSKMEHIKNMPAVVKHLLKDQGDHAVFANSSTPSEAIKYVNEMSKKLNGEQSPSPSEFKATPQLSSSTGTSDFNALSYINNSGRGRR